MKKWMNPEYIETMMKLAEILKNCQFTNMQFRGDVGTVYALLCKGDAWGINPEYMLSQSYIDNYGRLDHTGSVYRLALSNSNEVAKVSITESGEWSAVKGRFSVSVPNVTQDKIYTKLWETDIENELAVSVTVQFLDPNRSDVTSIRSLSSVDDSLKQLDHTWVTSPRKRLESMIIRDLCHNELYDLIHGASPEDTHAEINGYIGTISEPSSPPREETELEPERQVPNSQVTPDTIDENADYIGRAISIQDAVVKAQLNNNATEMKLRKNELVELTKEAINDPKVKDTIKNKLERIYEETAGIVIDDGSEILSAV
ncbi:hypothetical protein [Vibrio sp. TRT 29B02]|uniref:hypothetical protein n=1 Tax=Vibrio sp. TRT 29B02 TaxID=3418508 RepID=UPI003CF775A2